MDSYKTLNIKIQISKLILKQNPRNITVEKFRIKNLKISFYSKIEKFILIKQGGVEFIVFSAVSRI